MITGNARSSRNNKQHRSSIHMKRTGGEVAASIVSAYIKATSISAEAWKIAAKNTTAKGTTLRYIVGRVAIAAKKKSNSKENSTRSKRSNKNKSRIKSRSRRRCSCTNNSNPSIYSSFQYSCLKELHNDCFISYSSRWIRYCSKNNYKTLNSYICNISYSS